MEGNRFTLSARALPAVSFVLLVLLLATRLIPAPAVRTVPAPAAGFSVDAPAGARMQDGATPAAAASPAEPWPQETSVPSALTATIDALIPDDMGVYGVVAIDPEQTLVYAANATVPFISASLYKLPLMVQIYRLIEQRTLQLSTELFLPDVYWAEGDDSYYDWSMIGLTTTVDEALFATGAYSSNVGAWALAALTTWSEVNATALELGMIDTHLYVDPSTLAFWPPVPGPTDSPEAMAEAVAFIDTMASWWGPVMLTTPRDVAHVFALLLQGRVISAWASAAILDILSQQAVDDRFPWLLPVNSRMAHKTGNLDQVVHDAGILFTTEGPVVLAVLVESSLDDAYATTVIQQVAYVVFAAYDAPRVPGQPGFYPF